MPVYGLVITKYSVLHKDGWTPYFRHAESVGLRYFAQEDFEQMKAEKEEEELLRSCCAGVEGIFTCRESEVNPCDIEYLFCTLRQRFLLTGDTTQLRIPSVKSLHEVTYNRLLRLAELYCVNLYFVEDKLANNNSAFVER